MKYSVIRGSDLTPGLVDRWSEIQQGDATFASPYFCPEFTQAVSAVRGDVRVGLLEDAGRIVGFFPHQRRWDRVGRPVALRLSDYHGVVAEPGAEWCAADLLRACKLVRWEFDHLPATQTQFAAGFTHEDVSPVIELRGGYQTFEDSLDKAGRKQVRETRRKADRLAGRVGPLRFVEHSDDLELLHALMRWKSEKCCQTGVVDFFSLKWCRGLLEGLLSIDSKHFGVVLSCLYAGPNLVASHLALRSQTVWHSWFPAYDTRFAADSPGSILLLEVIKAAAKRSVMHVDLGKDVSVYKQRLMNASIQLTEGSVEVPSFLNDIGHWTGTIDKWSRQSTLRPVLKYPGRLLQAIGRRRRYV